MMSPDVLVGWLWRTTWQVSLLIVLVLLVQWLLKRFLTPRWRYFLWFLVLARMSLPALPESPFSLFNVVETPKIWSHIGWRSHVMNETGAYRPDAHIKRSETTTVIENPEANRDEVHQSPSMAQTSTQPTPSVPRVEEVRTYGETLILLWGIGALLFLAYTTGQSVATGVWCSRNRALDDREVKEVLEECKKVLGLRGSVRTIEAPAKSSPALMGALRPTLLLPAGISKALGKGNLRFVLLHELAHVKRRDIWVNWIATILLAVHWFNPLAWYSLRRMRSDQELACDDYVLRFTRPGESKDYGETVVRLLERATVPQRLTGVAGILEDRSLMKRRIQMIVDFKKPGPAWTTVTTVVSFALGLSMLTGAVSTETETSPSAETRTIVFPQDRSLGSLLIAEPQMAELGEWEALGEARGSVEIPEGKVAKLAISSEGMTDLSPLSNLQPDDLYAVEIRNIRGECSEIQHLQPLTSLRVLDLEHSGKEDSELSSVGQLSGLEELSLRSCDYSPKGLVHLGSLVNLKRLNLRQVKGLDDDAFGALAGLAALEELNLERTSITNSGLSVLSNFPNMRWLTLSWTGISDAGLEPVGKLSDLEYLDLYRCEVTDPGLRRLQGLGRLKSLELEMTKITNEGLQHLTGLSSLETLILDITAVDDGGLVYLQELPSLQRLDRSQTGITEEGLAQFESLRHLARLPLPDAPRAGVVFSYATAQTGWNGFPTYEDEQDLVEILTRENLNLFAVVEPDTESTEKLAEVLVRLRLEDKVIDGSKPDELENLDVVLSRWNSVLPDPLVDGLLTAVSRGVGMIFIGSNATRSGYTSKIRDLMGIADARRVWKGGGSRRTEVLVSHPILGFVEPGEEFWIGSPSGWAGVTDGTLLLLPPEGFEPDFCPLFVRDFMDGRVVCIQWLGIPPGTVPYSYNGCSPTLAI